MSSFNALRGNALIGEIQELWDYKLGLKPGTVGVKEECVEVRVVEKFVFCVFVGV